MTSYLYIDVTYLNRLICKVRRYQFWGNGEAMKRRESWDELFDQITPKELYRVLDGLMYDYARFALMNESPNMKAVNQLFYLKLLRDTIGKI